MAAEFFAPLPDTWSDVMQPVDPLLMVEDGYQSGPYAVGLGQVGSFDVDMQDDQGDHTLGAFAAAPMDPLYPSDIDTPVVHIYDKGHTAPPGLGGLPEMMDVFQAARFLFEGQ